jgi:hypothetical protein
LDLNIGRLLPQQLLDTKIENCNTISINIIVFIFATISKNTDKELSWASHICECVNSNWTHFNDILYLLSCY